MRTHKTLTISLILTSLMLLGSGSAFAQATRTWVSGVGDDVNPCSRTAPCKTFAGAISKTAAGGEINCLDSGGFGAVTITKSITILCEGVVGGVLHSSTTGILINGAGVKVVLRGLDINGAPPTSPGTHGIRFLQGDSLVVDNTRIYGSGGAAPNGNGILIANSAGLAKIEVTDSVIMNNGTGTAGAGIQVAPTGSGSVDLSVSNTQLLNNVVGLRADATTTSGVIDVSVVDSTAAGAPFHGFVALGTVNVRMVLNRVSAVNNADSGIRAVGAGALIRIGSSVVTGNGTGAFAASGGILQSYGNNQLDGNTVDGSVTPIALR
jgi:hypothetical protein